MQVCSTGGDDCQPVATATNLAETDATLTAAVESVRAASAATIADLTAQLAAARNEMTSRAAATADADSALSATVQSIAVSLARLDRITDDDVLELTCRGAQYITAAGECLSCTGPGANDGHYFNRVANSCQPCPEVALTWLLRFRRFFTVVHARRAHKESPACAKPPRSFRAL